MQIFVIHYTKLIERRKNMVMQLIMNDLDAEFVTQYDKEKIPPDQMKKFKSNFIPELTSLFLKHLYCYQEIANNYEYALILEDDAIFSQNFNEKLNSYIKQLPNDWDMLFIGDGCRLHIPYETVKNSNTNIFKKCLEPTRWGGNGATRCTDSYILSKKCAISILNEINQEGYQFDCALDWWMNELCRKLKFNIYWAEPTIVTQGSCNGMFNSSYNAT
jgi:glycosyl transferase family 25